MEKMFYSPCEFVGSTDSVAIQAAVDAAVATDIRVVVIPRKADGAAWNLEKTVYLPGDVTVVLDGATLKADCVAFQNTNADDRTTKSLGGEQHQMYIVGRCGATIEAMGAEPQIYFSNVRGYQIAGLQLKGGAGVVLNYARHGKIQQLKFRDCAYGLRLSEGCNNNIIEDIYAVTKKEAIFFQGKETQMFGRGLEMAETIVARVGARTAGAPAVKICAGPCETYNLIVKDIINLTQGATAVELGAPQDTQSIIDITVRNVAAAGGAAVKTLGVCDGLYIANAQGAVALESENLRVFVDESQASEVAGPLFSDDRADTPYITPNDPAYFGETDAQTLQNAVNAAAEKGAMLVIPRYNARTGGTVWNIEKAVNLPSGTTVGLLRTHLRQADFTYENLFRAEDARDITILGIGDAVLDGGLHNQLKMRNADRYGMNIRVNATVFFRNVENLVMENVQMKWGRWYSIYCEFCKNVRITTVDFEDHPILPDEGGIRIHSGCEHVLLENLTGIVGENMVHMEALLGDGICGDKSVDIHHVTVRNINSNNSSRLAVRILCQDGRQIYNVLVDGVLDPSLPEDKKIPWCGIALGSVQMATERLCTQEELRDITIRDVYSRGNHVLELGGNSANVTLINAHGFGSGDRLLATRHWADPRNFRGNGLFLRCIQGSRYMRGTATSMITDPKKFIGTIMNLTNYKATDTVLENVFAEKCGNAFTLTGTGKVEVRNFQIGQLGRTLSDVAGGAVLMVNGEVQPTKE